MTAKQVCHLELCEKSVWEWIQDKTVSVVHVAGKINPADIFTKEMKDETHFCHLYDSSLCTLASFQQDLLLAIYHKQ